MHVIKGLLIKDFQTVKSYKTTILIMLLIFIGGGMLNDDIATFLPITIPLCFEMVGISSFSYDNLAKSDAYLLTFPLKRKEMVKARYLYILLFTLLGVVVGLFATTFIQFIRAGNILSLEVVKNNFALVIGALCGMIFLQAFQIPVNYKYGAEKGRIIQMIMIIALMLGISLVTTMLMNVFSISFDSLTNMLKEYGMAIIGIVVMLLYGLSYKISCQIYEKT